MNPMQTAAVAPVNWKASQMPGIKFAPMKMRVTSPVVIKPNLTLSWAKGLPRGNRRPSRFSRKGYRRQ